MRHPSGPIQRLTLMLDAHSDCDSESDTRNALFVLHLIFHSFWAQPFVCTPPFVIRKACPMCFVHTIWQWNAFEWNNKNNKCSVFLRSRWWWKLRSITLTSIRQLCKCGQPDHSFQCESELCAVAVSITTFAQLPIYAASGCVSAVFAEDLLKRAFLFPFAQFWYT